MMPQGNRQTQNMEQCTGQMVCTTSQWQGERREDCPQLKET